MQLKTLAPVVLGLGLTVGLVACSQEGAEEAYQQAATATYASADLLAEVRDQYIEHYNLGHAPAVAGLYTEDGVYMPASGSIGLGRNAISGVLEGSVAASPTLEITALETIIEGDVAFERGTYGVTMTPEGAEPVSFSGNYLTFSKRQSDDSFKLHWVLSNYDAAPSPAVAASMTQGTAAVESGGDAALDALRETWQNAYNQADGATTAALHTEDGFIMFADAPAIEGRAAFAASLEEVFATSPMNEITQIDTQILGDWAVARGVYEQQMTSPDGAAMSQSGYWLYVGRKGDDGAWKIHWIISNAVAPTE
jgi:uncharacterized protein (TIGR02246 family)